VTAASASAITISPAEVQAIVGGGGAAGGGIVGGSVIGVGLYGINQRTEQFSSPFYP